MPGSISVGISCRDIDALGNDEAAVRQFVEGHVFPAVLMEIMSRREAYFNGFPAAQRGALSPELMARGCEIGGSISISF